MVIPGELEEQREKASKSELKLTREASKAKEQKTEAEHNLASEESKHTQTKSKIAEL